MGAFDMLPGLMGGNYGLQPPMQRPMPMLQPQAQQTMGGRVGGILGDFMARLQDMRQNNPEALMALGAGLMQGNVGAGFAGAGDAMAQYREKMAGQQEKQRQDSLTKRYLMAKGISEEEADAAAANPEILSALLKQAAGGERQPIINVGDGQLFDPNTGGWISNPNAPKKPPTLSEIFDPKTGQPMKVQWNQQTGEFEPIGGVKSGSGLSITLPDGTQVQQGTFGNQDQKNVANRVTEAQELAASGAALKQTVAMLREANSKVGYSGPGAGAYGVVDGVLEGVGSPLSLPGDTGSRAVMTAGGLEVALAQVQKTKGAISNAEMALFMAASPGLANTQQGNAALFDMIEAVADRQVQRASEMEKYRQQYGTLDGFESQWNAYINANPLIISEGGGIRLNSGPRRPQVPGQAPAQGGVIDYRDYFGAP